MQTIGIKIEGRQGYFATITRRDDSSFIEIEILTPEHPNGKKHQAQADCEDDIYSMASLLQFELDGFEGSAGDIYEYYVALQQFED